MTKLNQNRNIQEPSIWKINQSINAKIKQIIVTTWLSIHIILHGCSSTWSSPERRELEEYAQNLDNSLERLSIGETNNTAQIVTRLLLQLESRWNPDAQSPTGAIGIGQLTSIVYEDMDHGRIGAYKKRFEEIANNTKVQEKLPESVQIAFSGYKHMPWSYHLLIKMLWSERNHPYVNLLISLTLRDIIEDNISIQESNTFIKGLRTHQSELNYEKFNDRLKTVYGHEQYHYREMTPDRYIKMLDYLESHPQLCREIAATESYNGGNWTQRYKEFDKTPGNNKILTEKNIYLIILSYMTVENERSKYKK